jgi:DNA-binding beta-propeller fold protein YncE
VLNIAGTTVTHAKRDFAGGFKPYGIEITPDGTLAIAAHVGAGATGGVDTISVIDLAASPAMTIDQIAAGPTVEGITIAPDGRHVAATIMDGSNLPPSSPFYRRAGRLQIFAIEKRKLRLVAEAESGRWCQGVAWNRTGTTVVVQCAADREIIPFTFDGRALVRGQAVRVTGGPSGIRTADVPR